jgi:hypothetical protein
MTTAKSRILGGSALTLVILVGALALGREQRHRSQESCQGPWSECSPDAQWLRRVVLQSGLRDAPPGTGSALLITREGPSGLFMWAVRQGRTAASLEDFYAKLVLVEDTQVYTDGVRIVWRVQDRHVFLEPPPELKLLEKLVRLTNALPAPGRG